MQQRTLGSTGRTLSLIGFGGIVVKDATTQEAAERVGTAIDGGVNYFDVAPSYGNAEEMLGPALAPYRDGVFLACKTQKRDREGAAAERARPWPACKRTVSICTIARPVEAGGCGAGFRAGRGHGGVRGGAEAGLVRHLGFSAHSSEVALEALRRFPFDSVLFPVNYVTWNAAGSGRRSWKGEADRGRAAGAQGDGARPGPQGQPARTPSAGTRRWTTRTRRRWRYGGPFRRT